MPDTPTSRAFTSRFNAPVRPAGGLKLLALAVAVGVGAGFGAVGFRELIALLATKVARLDSFIDGPWYLLPLVPAAGGLLVGLITDRFAREARGHGVPEVMYAVVRKGGRIRFRVVFAKAIASAICIASGGSVGREGPIVQIGSALGSGFAQLLKLREDAIRTLVGCGAAAGISATFNAPIAGAIFALEVILRDFHFRTLWPIICASVMGAVVTRGFYGDARAFQVPAYALVTHWELVSYALLGLFAGGVGVLFSRGLYFFEDRVERTHIPGWLQPAVGGLLVGGMALLVWKLTAEPFADHQVMGVGYMAIENALAGTLIFKTVAILLVFKLVASCTTLGTGGSGGIFAPSLFLGAMLGLLFGLLMQQLFPGAEIQPGSYALVGMAAMVAATTHAPLAAMIIVYEMTADYEIILPLMLTTTLGTLVSRAFSRESIYTLKLSRRGERIHFGTDVTLLESMPVEGTYSRKFDTVAPATPLSEIVERLKASRFSDFPVVDDKGLFHGLIQFDDVRLLLDEEALDQVVVAADIMRPDPPLLRRDQNLADAMEIFTHTSAETLPVVENDRCIGILERADLLKHYQLAVSLRESTS